MFLGELFTKEDHNVITVDVDSIHAASLNEHLKSNPALYENREDFRAMRDFLDTYATDVPSVNRSYVYVSVHSTPLAQFNSIAYFQQPHKLVKLSSDRAYFDINGTVRQFPEVGSLAGDAMSQIYFFKTTKEFNHFVTIAKLKFPEYKYADKVLDESLDEGWKDWVAGATMGAAALGAQPADAKPMLQQPVAQKAADTGINILSNNIRSEEVVHRTAKAAGIKGTELAQFMAQTKHESADFGRMKEIGGKKYFHNRYDPKTAPKTAKILGNKQVGDGVKYHGRGYIQITGRDNYRMAGQALGLPLEQHPDLAAKPDIAAKIAVWYWNTRVKPNVSNFADTAAVTRLINPAMRGLQDRQANFIGYKKIL